MSQGQRHRRITWVTVLGGIFTVVVLLWWGAGGLLQRLVVGDSENETRMSSKKIVPNGGAFSTEEAAAVTFKGVSKKPSYTSTVSEFNQFIYGGALDDRMRFFSNLSVEEVNEFLSAIVDFGNDYYDSSPSDAIGFLREHIHNPSFTPAIRAIARRMGEDERYLEFSEIFLGNDLNPSKGYFSGVDGYISGLAKVDPSEAFDFARTMDREVTIPLNHIVFQAAQAGKYREILELLKTVKPVDYELQLDAVFTSWADSKPREAAEFLLSRSGDHTEDHLKKVLAKWKGNSPGDYVTWIGRLVDTEALERIKRF